MNFRQSLKSVSLLVLAIIAGGSLGCGLFGPNVANPLPPPGGYDPVKVAVAAALRPADNLTIRLDMTMGREEHMKIVDEEGNIELPFIGKIKMAGLTVTQAQEAVRKAYVPRYYSYLTVTVVLQTTRVVYLSGEMRGAGGAVPYREDMTVYRVIMAAGGFSEFAKRREVVLTREGKQLIVDCVKIEQHPELDIPLLPGDNIFIRRSAF